MSPRFAVVGAGRQGTAAAYDLGLRGEAQAIVVADLDLDVATRSARRVDALLGRPLATAAAVDASDANGLFRLLEPCDAAVSAVPYRLNPAIAEVAVAAGTHLCDLGGNTALVRRQLRLDAPAREAGVSLVPDCGQVPGMGTSLMVYAMGLLDEAAEVRMWDGGIPQEPSPPWSYGLTFHIAGLTNEYDGHGVFLRDGRRVEVPCFDPEGDERVEIPGVGILEAFVTAGGTSTLPWTFENRVRTLENRTLRWPGHAAQWRAFVEAGLLGLEPIAVEGVPVVPREVLHALLGPRLEAPPGFRDLVVVRVEATGRKNGRPAVATVELVDRYDEATGLTAMQRTTGWDAAIVCAMMARGQTPRGAIPRELSVDPTRYAEELRRRGLPLSETVRESFAG